MEFWPVIMRHMFLSASRSRTSRRRRAACLPVSVMLAAGLLSLSAPAAAQTVAEFYSGKSINLLIGFSPGGGYDLYARTLARHMGRFIPGNPRLVPQNMPGAGSLRAINYLYGDFGTGGNEGGTGNDTLHGGTGNDQLFGEMRKYIRSQIEPGRPIFDVSYSPLPSSVSESHPFRSNLRTISSS